MPLEPVHPFNSVFFFFFVVGKEGYIIHTRKIKKLNMIIRKIKITFLFYNNHVNLTIILFKIERVS